MTPAHEEPLELLIKRHPMAYFAVMFLLGVAFGTIVVDLLALLDQSVPTTHLLRYLAAVGFAFGAHLGLSWRLKRRRKSKESPSQDR